MGEWFHKPLPESFHLCLQGDMSLQAAGICKQKVYWHLKDCSLPLEE